MTQEDRQDLPIINFEKFEDIVCQFKIPLIFASLGLLFFAINLGLILKRNPTGTNGIIFQEATVSAKTKIKVDIQGEVLKPGVYVLDDGSRIGEAIEKAGGLTEKADRQYLAKNINQAAKLTDGGKIYIPGKGASDLSNLSNLSDVSGKRVSLNTASQAQLESLPGIGPVTAGKIISARPYQRIEELKEKKVISDAVFEKIKDLLSLY